VSIVHAGSQSVESNIPGFKHFRTSRFAVGR
jgi:hypothetical protein